MPNTSSSDFGLVMNDATKIHYFIIDKPPDGDKLFINTILIQNASPLTNAKLGDSMAANGGAPQIDVTRCICDMDHDDGFMICCDKCLVWQHIVCMDVNRKKIPDKFFCEKCMPRPVNVAKAKFMQKKYLENLKNLKKNESTNTLALNGGGLLNLNNNTTAIDLHANNSDLYDHEMMANELVKDTVIHKVAVDDAHSLNCCQKKQLVESSEPILERTVAAASGGEILLSADEEAAKNAKNSSSTIKQRKYRPKTIREELESHEKDTRPPTIETNDAQKTASPPLQARVIQKIKLVN